MTMCQLGPILFSDDPGKLIDYLKAKGLFFTAGLQKYPLKNFYTVQWTWQATRGDGFVALSGVS